MNLLSDIDKVYTSALGIFNPYHAMTHRINPDLPHFDAKAYKINPHYQKVYDKLFVASSQGMKCGELKTLKGKKDIEFPIFIKPRYGHLTASSKYCYKIKKYADLAPHFDKPDMMWSEFVDAKETMTDFILVDGKIVYQLTYIYSEKQNGFADVWKFISPDNKPPSEVVDWVTKNMVGYTGPLNVQYRSTKIIEVGMRFARSGMYLESTQNKVLIETINQMWVTKSWSNRSEKELSFKPFYSFKCWSPIPIIYLLPQHLLDFIIWKYGGMTFYEYYFEPTGTSSTIFFQFLHRDFEKGMRLKVLLERIALTANILVYVGLLAGIVAMLAYGCSTVLILVVIVMMTGLDNSLVVIFNQLKNQKQFVGL
jgi:hypothetical protein